MRISVPRTGVIVFAAAAVGAGVLVGLGGGLQPARTLEFACLILAAVVAGAVTPRSTGDDRVALPPSVFAFASLLLFGAHPTVLVAASGVIAHGLAAERPRPGRILWNAVTLGLATEAAGFVHAALGGTTSHFAWPRQAVPIAAAAAAYCVVKVVSTRVVAPLVTRRTIDRTWGARLLQNVPHGLIGAAVAVGLVEALDHRLWSVMLVAAVPFYFACQAYYDYLTRLDGEHQQTEVIDALDHGMSVVDSNGRVTLWNETLARFAGCTREQALGRPVAEAVPVLANTELPKAIQESLSDRQPRTLAHLGLPSSAGARVMEVKILPVADGATLLWHDITERLRAEQVVKRNEERLALAAEGANDGLWEWDLRRQELYVSGRWKTMLGLPGQAATGAPDEWLGRVHAEDLAALRQALEDHLAGKSAHLQHEHRIRHEDGSYRWFMCRGVAQRGAGRRSGRIAGSLTDTTEGAVAQERLRTAGALDPLTGLCNRAVFVEGLGRRLAEFKQRRGGDRFAVLYLDLDRFKIVNDSLGHLVGDELLRAVSRRLEGCLRPADALARLGGDEFAILLNGLSDEAQANAIAFRIQEALSSPIPIGGREVFTTASIGIAFGLSQYDDPDEIMRDADTAMYHAKSRGKARHEVFDADMHAKALDRLGLENDLRHAVSNNDFEMHYQPIVFLASGRCVGFESLIRWKRNGEPISPATFIPMAEELGLIEPLGTWVLQQVCQTFADWQRRFPNGGLDCITVNVSSRQLMQQNFLYLVEQAVHKSGLKPCDLRLEITETALMDSPHIAAAVLRELRDFGVKIYLDDFGTGYSSLSHLHKLPVDALKIDRSFVKSLQMAERSSIVESILALARTMNTSVVAEGIESDEQAIELERLGCTHAQGYLFSKPLSTKAAEELLAGNQPLGPKKVKPEEAAADIAKDPQLFYTSVPFEWPDDVPVRRQATQEAGTLAAAAAGDRPSR